MNLSAADRRHLRRALESAIQWEDSLSDAHHVAFNKRNPIAPKTVPPEYRSIVARCTRRAEAYRALLKRLRGSGDAER